ncbi:M24 family metallopeptidase [Candidatus Bathyarchaeota archaeon]|nr:aminopeptidase P family protein [Candidatus Bathyarchaeota archaeon]NIU81560.1 M24 family metallopeptidase [Candidatus Bathyarchaeota archaeon]NIV68196.1 M24 family metallopeptidase [Candidatus Bathyarchaeota archaeon]NIW16578.1 M24 family metallopeptidase [Candidatus Bathyarchaeota archaeon]NIW34797.1 M24 family metallopeptidase [Candidatus Bathyarchaeota archaeon]
MVKIAISEKEYKRRIERVRQELVRRELDALYLTSGTSFLYLTGYSYIVTERPAALIVPVEGELTFLGPHLERDHIPLATTLVKSIKTYLDYPGEDHSLGHFASFLEEMGLGKKRIGIDNPAGAAGRWGYRGPKIEDKLPGAEFVEAKEIVEDLRLIKSEEEIQLIRESAKWANLAQSLLQEYTEPGLWDVDISLMASYEASMIMKKTLGREYRPCKRGLSPAGAGFRGQVGAMSAIPHAISTRRMIREGDIIITGAGADIGGYSSELERTMIVGEPSDQQRRLFEVMLQAQDTALAAFRPGAKCSDIDRAARKVILEAGYGDLIRHHTGHGLGLDGHEPPWLDVGDDTVLKPGMVLSCEPGIYKPGYAGFRHSDTVLITEAGAEILTYYPRDLQSLTIKKR